MCLFLRVAGSHYVYRFWKVRGEREGKEREWEERRVEGEGGWQREGEKGWRGERGWEREGGRDEGGDGGRERGREEREGGDGERKRGREWKRQTETERQREEDTCVRELSHSKLEADQAVLMVRMLYSTLFVCLKTILTQYTRAASLSSAWPPPPLLPKMFRGTLLLRSHNTALTFLGHSKTVSAKNYVNKLCKGGAITCTSCGM